MTYWANCSQYSNIVYAVLAEVRMVRWLQCNVSMGCNQADITESTVSVCNSWNWKCIQRWHDGHHVFVSVAEAVKVVNQLTCIHAHTPRMDIHIGAHTLQYGRC